MTDLHRKVSALLDASLQRDVLVDLLIDVIARGLGRLGGRPRKDTANVSNDVSEPVSEPPQNPRSLDLILIPDPVPSGPQKQDPGKGECDEPADFPAFWAAYPRKVAKADARRAWARKKPPIDLCLAAIEWQRESKQWREGYIPHPATWINGGRWEDPRPGARVAPPSADGRQPYKPTPFVPREEWPGKEHP